MPFKDMFLRYGVKTAWLLLCLVGLYRISDIVLGVSSNIFYQDIGFTKIEIASAVKTYGVIISIVGGILGGLIATHIGLLRTLLWGAILSCLTNVLFIILAHVGDNLSLMYFVVSADNLAAGFASAAFVAFLSKLTNISFTAVQYAVLSSIMTLLPKTLGGYSGGIIEQIGYPGFFLFTTLIGLPVIWLTIVASRKLD
jgi:PAT family beta-lactamase induction signal transducer AmpG